MSTKALPAFRPSAVPLDSRSDYTKLDWELWTAALTDDKEYVNAICDAVYLAVSETAQRVPITDWYFASTAKQAGFQNRTVLGGFYILLLLDK